MPVYSLSEDLVFPPPHLADESGLLAVGGDLKPERLLLAYQMGIFPWYSDDQPIMWWSPDPRMILIPSELKVSKSMKRVLNSKKHEVRYDTDFKSVIEQCAKVPRRGQSGTWITDEMKTTYIELFNAGYAHSVEVYCNNKLTGGLYGLNLGGAFFGESMFFTSRDASKIALYYLVKRLLDWNFVLIDAQVETDHLKSLGAKNVARSEFLKLLNSAMNSPTKKGKW